MPAFIRYSFFGCVILALSACGSSGSSRLLEPEAPAMPMDDSPPVSTVQEAYSSVDYLITGIPAVIAKFVDQVYKDANGNQYLLTDDNVANMNLEGVELPMGVTPAPAFADLLAVYEDAAGNEYLLTPDNVANMNLEGVELPMDVTTAPAFADLTKVREGATALPATITPAHVDALRDARVNSSNRYLSTGAVLTRTDDNDDIIIERSSATCADGEVTGHAKCDFEMDNFREAMTFSLGPGSSIEENRVSFRDFMADREPVMIYRQALMSQVRTSDTGESVLPRVYKDADGNRYLLTINNVANMDLEDVELPMGVTEEMAPAFADLLAVYEDADGNEYLLTPDNVANMNLEGVELPMGVTEEMAPAFADLTQVLEGEALGYEYVGYDGILRHSMFFVGVYRFFDDEGVLEHTRFENASLGSIYDDDRNESDIQNPSVALTGEGVMVGMERRVSDLEHHLVQGDVNINYSPFDDNETPNDMTDDMRAMIDISIDNIQRMANDDDAWYADPTRQARLSWRDVEVIRSKFSEETTNLLVDPGVRSLKGSFYGTEGDPEVGGVFRHEGSVYEIIGSFGSKLDEVPMEDPDDMMGQ